MLADTAGEFESGARALDKVDWVTSGARLLETLAAVAHWATLSATDDSELDIEERDVVRA